MTAEPWPALRIVDPTVFQLGEFGRLAESPELRFSRSAADQKGLAYDG